MNSGSWLQSHLASDLGDAIAVLESYQERFLLALSVGDVFAARLIALVGSDGEVNVATAQPEFDRSLTVRPRRSGAMPFNVHIISGYLIVIDSDHLGWWTFGGESFAAALFTVHVALRNFLPLKVTLSADRIATACAPGALRTSTTRRTVSMRWVRIEPRDRNPPGAHETRRLSP